jgi:hypothetical protein
MVRAACHIHSEWSYDAKWSIASLADEFGRRGYRIVMMSEHDRGFTEGRRLEHRAACAAASSENVFVLPGIEYSDAANTVHVLVWGPVPFVGENVPTAELLKTVKAAGGIAVLAHPARRKAAELYDSAWANSLLGIEVWNRKTDGWAPSRAAFPLLERTSLVPFVGMDFHTRNQIFPLAMELDLPSEVNEASILDCLRHRRCRATAFGRPVTDIADGWFHTTLTSAERCRRSAASVYRSWKKQLVG